MREIAPADPYRVLTGWNPDSREGPDSGEAIEWQHRTRTGEDPITVPAGTPPTDGAGEQYLKFDEDEFRAQVAKEVVLYFGERSGIPILTYPAAFLSRVDRVAQSAQSVAAISEALRNDFERGDTSFSEAVSVTAERLGDAFGSEAGAAVMERLLASRPPAAVLAFVLGPTLIDSIIADVPKALDEAVEVTGFHWNGSRYKFDWKAYNPTESEVSPRWSAWQREAAAAHKDMLKGIWADIKAALTEEVQRVKQQMRGK